MKSIPFLDKGDKILLIAPAKAIESEYIDHAISMIEDRGYVVELGKYCRGAHFYFSGTEEERLHDLQWSIDHTDAKAILCARGGYGCVQIVDRADWSGFIKNPKWMIGFSDITVLHSRINKLGFQSVHGSMPLNFKENGKEAIQTLFDAIEKENYTISCEAKLNNHNGVAEGEIVGGNLSILYSLIGTNDAIDLSDRILFIEDVGEHLYALDRMLYALQKSNSLVGLRGLLIGGMTDMKDTAAPFGMSLEEIILSHFKNNPIPIAFGVPCGHINDNRAIRCGSPISLKVSKESTLIEFK